ncbi:MAG TPA: hypothetical protein VKQ30_03155 [Ktedonobacterales bacterium]|nr:hypothetical protein [Ktedonobacterales bacterium]
MARRTPDKRTGKARQGTHPKPPAPTLRIAGGNLRGGSIDMYQVKSGQAAQKIIAKAARANQRVDMVVTLKDGRRVALLSNQGRGLHAQGASARGLRKGLSGSKLAVGGTASSLRGFAASVAERFDSDQRRGERFDPDDIVEFQVNVLSR